MILIYIYRHLPPKSRNPSRQRHKWQCSAILPGQGSGEKKSLPVSKVAILTQQTYQGAPKPYTFLAAATVESLTIWRGDTSTWEVVFSLSMPPVQIPCSLSLIPLGVGQIAFFVGTADTKIHVWSGMVDQEAGTGSMKWTRIGALAGHQGWVRALDWRPSAASVEEDESTDRGGRFVASGSQDGKIRIWKIELIEGRDPGMSIYVREETLVRCFGLTCAFNACACDV